MRRYGLDCARVAPERSDGAAAEAAILLGPYELLERINVGGMAEIVKARALEMPGQPLVALKRILPHLSDDAQFVTMFLDESRMLSRLHHPHIIPTLEVGTIDGVPYLALEFVDGKDARMLFHRCRRDGVVLPQPLACYIIAATLDGLQYAHDHTDAEGKPLNLVHRDVSLQNILLSYDGDVKITDFGIARSADNEAQTEAGIVKGKFGYMSPEQIRSQELDRRSDVFAAGICLYELLTGERLFSGDNDYAAVERVRNVTIDPPSVRNRAIPSALEKIVMRSLAKHTKDRYQSAAEMSAALTSFVASAGQAATALDLGRYLRRAFIDRTDAVSLPADATETDVAAEEPTAARGSNSAVPAGVDQGEAAKVHRVPPLIPSRSSIPAAAFSGRPDPFSSLGESQEESDEDEDVTRQVQHPLISPATQSGAAGTKSENPSFPAATTMSQYTSAQPALAQPDFPHSPASARPTGPWLLRGVDVRIPLTLFAFGVSILFAIGAMVDSTVDTCTVQLVVSPSDAIVEVDGRPVSATQSPFVLSEIEAGVPHSFRVHKDGYREWTARMTVSEGEVVALPAIDLLKE